MHGTVIEVYQVREIPSITYRPTAITGRGISLDEGVKEAIASELVGKIINLKGIDNQYSPRFSPVFVLTNDKFLVCQREYVYNNKHYCLTLAVDVDIHNQNKNHTNMWVKTHMFYKYEPTMDHDKRDNWFVTGYAVYRATVYKTGGVEVIEYDRVGYATEIPDERETWGIAYRRHAIPSYPPAEESLTREDVVELGMIYPSPVQSPYDI